MTKEMYTQFFQMWDLSSIVLCFIYFILSHTKQQTIPMSCFLGSLVITLKVEIEQRGMGI